MAKFKYPSAVLVLLLANIAIFIVQQFVPGFTESYLLHAGDFFTAPWTLITSMFLHGGAFHLIFNMYALFIFGPLIETRIGTRRFYSIYFISGILAAFISQFFYPAALGASGAIMGIIGMVIMLLPDLRVLMFFIIPMSMRTAGVIFALLDITLLFVPGSPIASIAHLVGLACGLVYGYYIIRRYARRQQGKAKAKGLDIHMSQKELDEYFKEDK